MSKPRLSLLRPSVLLGELDPQPADTTEIAALRRQAGSCIARAIVRGEVGAAAVVVGNYTAYNFSSAGVLLLCAGFGGLAAAVLNYADAVNSAALAHDLEVGNQPIGHLTPPQNQQPFHDML